MRAVSIQECREINKDVGRVLITLYCMPDTLSINDVAKRYIDFLNGKFDIVDVNTGEFLDRNLCRNGYGIFIFLSAVEIWKYLNQPSVSVVVGLVNNGLKLALNE